MLQKVTYLSTFVSDLEWNNFTVKMTNDKVDFLTVNQNLSQNRFNFTVVLDPTKVTQANAGS